LTEPVLHIPGAHQVNSSLGLSLLEPFVILLGQHEIVDRAVNDAERFPQSDSRDAWLSRTRALAQRAADDRTRRIETLLGGATRPFSEPPTDLYFPGFELMAPAVDQLSFSDGMNLQGRDVGGNTPVRLLGSSPMRSRIQQAE
jgi:hypothetical protein